MCAATAKEYVQHFRLKELKDALGRLSLPRSGKKHELQQRLYDVLQEPRTMVSLNSYIRTPSVSLEEAARVVAEVYRELQGSTRRSPNQLASIANEVANSNTNSNTNGYAHGNVVDVPATEQENGVIRCPCGVNADSHQLMVQCDVCGVWVHCSCFGLGGSESDLPAQFYCDVCRAGRADPFWQSMAVVFPSTMLQAVAQQSSPMLSLERTFLLTRSHMRMLQSNDCQLQVMCMLLNDAVSFRFHWPTFANLRVNVMPVRVYTRGGQQQLGNNARDEPAKISAFVREGINRVALTAYDTRPFAMMIVISRQRLLQELTAQVVRDESQDAYEIALERVRQRCGGGKSSEENGDDNDLVALSSVVSLRDPLGGMRIQEPGRYRDCTHLACFDLPTYLEMQQRTRKWQCPICLKHAAVETLYVDPYFLRVLRALEQDEDATEIELAVDASWRPRDEDGKVLNEAWHSPEWDAPLLPPLATSQPASNGVHELSDAEDESTQDASRKRSSQGAGTSAAPAKKQKGATIEYAISLSDSDDEAPAAVPSAQMKSEGEGVTSNQSEPDFARLLASFTTDSQTTSSLQDSTFPAYASLAQSTAAPSTSYSSSVEHSTSQGRFHMSHPFSTLHTSQPADARNLPWGTVPSTSMWPQLASFGQPHAAYGTRPRAIRPQPMLPSSWQTQLNFANPSAPAVRTTRPHASTAHQFNLMSNPWRQVSSQVDAQNTAGAAAPPVVSSAASTLLNLTSSTQQSSYYNAPLDLGPLPSSTFNALSNGHSPRATQATHNLTTSTAISLDSDEDDEYDDGDY